MKYSTCILHLHLVYSVRKYIYDVFLLIKDPFASKELFTRHVVRLRFYYVIRQTIIITSLRYRNDISLTRMPLVVWNGSHAWIDIIKTNSFRAAQYSVDMHIAHMNVVFRTNGQTR